MVEQVKGLGVHTDRPREAGVSTVEWTGLAFVVSALIAGIVAVTADFADPLVCKVGNAISSLTGGGVSDCSERAAERKAKLVPQSSEIVLSSESVSSEFGITITPNGSSNVAKMSFEAAASTSESTARRADNSSKVSVRGEGKIKGELDISLVPEKISEKLGLDLKTGFSASAGAAWSKTSSLVCGGDNELDCDTARQALKKHGTGDGAKIDDSYESRFQRKYQFEGNANLGAEWKQGPGGTASSGKEGMKGMGFNARLAFEFTDVTDRNGNLKEKVTSISYGASWELDLSVQDIRKPKTDANGNKAKREVEFQGGRIFVPLEPKGGETSAVEVIVKEDAAGNVTEVTRVKTYAGTVSNQSMTMTEVETVKVNDSNRELLSEYGRLALVASPEAKQAFEDAVYNEGKKTRALTRDTEWFTGGEIDLWLIKLSNKTSHAQSDTISYEYLGEPDANGEREWVQAELPE